jgi:glutamate synthase domain-containing protein 2
MEEIHRLSRDGHSINEPMRTKLPVLSWDDILITAAQLARLPLNKEEEVNTRTVIGPSAQRPLTIDTPILISHMSFGALSREAVIALAKGSAAAGTAMGSGEGGILEEGLQNASKFIFEYVPNKYSVSDENLKRVSAIEIKIGQSAKPGMGGHLPGKKVNFDIARIRGRPEGEEIISPARFPEIYDRTTLKQAVDMLRERSGGRPIGIKLATGKVEEDLEVALFAGPDFITIDGRPGSTGSAPKYVKDSTAVPTILALSRARAFLDGRGAQKVSLIVTGGLRVSSDFAKALAMGADAVAIATAAMIAIGCQQYRVCHTDKCPVGITTHDPALRARFDVDNSAKMLENFLGASTEELKTFARITGNRDVHGLSTDDLCTVNSEISGHTRIRHAGQPSGVR